MSFEAIDLTLPDDEQPVQVVKKARTTESVDIPTSSSSAPSISNSKQTHPTSSSSAPWISNSKQKLTSKKSKAHVLLWVCAAGKGRGRNWKNKSLRVIGVYPSKEDGIDLVVRPVEEVKL